MEKSEIKTLFRLLESSSQQLSQYQADLVKGLKKYFNRNSKLSPRQEDALVNIAHNLVPELMPAGSRERK
jgi:hypothetical protein